MCAKVPPKVIVCELVVSVSSETSRVTAAVVIPEAVQFIDPPVAIINVGNNTSSEVGSDVDILDDNSIEVSCRKSGVSGTVKRDLEVSLSLHHQ